VRKIKVSPSIEIAHTKALQKCNAIYPIHRTEIEILPIAVGAGVLSRDGLFAGKIPRKLVIAILHGSSLNGSVLNSPYRFVSEIVRRIDITLDGEPVGDTPISCDFPKDLYVRAYDSMYSALNKSYSDVDLDIDKFDFKDMYALFCFDLTADSCGNTEDHIEKDRSGTLRITLGLKNVTETYYALFYAEFEDTIEITASRQVLL
jgi:hypothetical protein